MDQETTIYTLEKELKDARSRIQRFIRESEIQAALETVRAASLAMRHTSELQHVINAVGTQFKSLEIDNTGGVFVIINQSLDKELSVWGSGDTAAYRNKVHIPYLDRPIYTNLINLVKKGPGLSTETYSNEEKQEFFRHMFEIPPYNQTSKEHQRNWLAREGGYTRTVAVCRHTTLFMINHHGRVFSDEENQILSRFGAVFEQSYIRFLDLQKAEKQAREAQIEAALERVRAASMAMHRSDQLIDVSNVMYDQLRKLGIDQFAQCGFVLINEEKAEQYVWGSSEADNKLMAYYVLPLFGDQVFEDRYKTWKEGKTFYTQILNSEQLKDHIEVAMPENRITDRERDAKRDMPETTYFYFGNFSSGYLQVISGVPLTPEFEPIFKRFTKVFEQSYTRFLDLKKAEGQAREAKIEAALERVRSRSLAMHQSDELREVVSVLYQEVGKLGLADWGCNLQIFDPAEKTLQIWLSEDENQIHPKSYFFRDAGHPHIEMQWNKWEQKETYFTISLSGSDKKSYDDYVLNYTDFRHFPDEIKANIRSLDQVYFNFAWMKYGFLVGISVERPMEDPEFETLGRFANVFEQTYTRFYDIQKAEAQAREAQIEAALERVRSKSLAMHKAVDLTQVISTIYQELENLQVELIRCLIFTTDLENSLDTWWMANSEDKENPIELSIKHIDLPANNSVIEAWKLKKSRFVLILEGEEKKEWDRRMLTETELSTLPENVKEGMRSPPKTYVNISFNNYGGLTFVSTKPLPEQQFHIITRFAKVFNQAYARFLDLQKAEAQAREAQIEAALERVRAASMAMHRSEDLSTVALTFFQQIERLEIPINAASINLVNESTESYRLYFANRHNIGITDELDIRDFWFATESFRRLQEGEKEFTKICEGDQLKAWIDYIKRDISEERGVQLEVMNPSKSYIHSVQFHELSHTIFTSISPLSQSVLTVLKRMTQAFGMSYIRFLDLQKAEEQAREAQIEAALERIRARTMAMHTSDEFRETIGILFDQLNLLDFDIQQCSLTIINEHEDEAESWQSATTQSVLPTSFKMRFPDDPYFRENIRESLLKKQGYSVITFEGEDKKQFDAYIFENTPVRHAPEEVINFMKSHNKIVLCRAYMKYGFIETVSNTSKLNPDKEAILQRFSKVLEQTYTRFLDLKKAEAQAKEAQIETALERVRAQTMAMHSSDDVGKCIVKMFDEITALGVDEDTRFGIGILNHETQINELWTASKEGQEIKMHIGHIDMTWHPLLKSARKTWKAQKALHEYVLEGEDLLNYYQMLNNAPDYPLHVEIKNLPKKQFHYGFVFEHGFFYAFTLSELNSDLIHIIQRFTAVFAQTYRRYLDLVKAEAQAREAKIEAALEKVRAKSLAMHRSEELADLSLELVKQVQALGIETWFCAFNIYDDDPKGSLEWGSNGEGTFPKYRTPREGIFLKYFDAGQNGETLLVNEIGEDECPAHYEYLCSLPGVGDQLLQMKSEGIPFPEYQIDHVAFFKYGYLIFITYKAVPESHEVFKRFAKVFEQSYTRFLDLRKAEQQARESQVEAALERVRSQTMAMQSSHDIGASVTSLFESLIDLGISEKVRCGIGILNHDDTSMDLWTASSNIDSKVILSTGQIDMAEHRLLRGARNSWKAQESLFSYVLKGEDMINYYQVINNSANYPTKFDVNNLPQEIHHNSFVFEHGLLYAFSDAPLPHDVLQILERLSTVFEHTYTRFLDLQNAELREKEAVKQASLDRIRAETASMRTASDLDQIIPLIWRELSTLKIPFIRCGVFIMDESESVIHNYLSTPEGEAIASFVLPYETPGTISQILNHWRRKEMFLDYWDQESMIAFSNVLVDNGIFSDPKDYLETLPQQGFHLHFLPFIQGMLYVGNTTPLDSDQIDLLQGGIQCIFNGLCPI